MAPISPEYENVSLADLQAQFEEHQRRQELLLEAMREKQEEAKYEIASQIKELVHQQGMDMEVILPLLGCKQGDSRNTRSGRASKSGNGGTKRSQTYYYVDPDDSRNTYQRGMIPGWMRDKMNAAGFDHTSKEDRERFKAEHLRLVRQEE